MSDNPNAKELGALERIFSRHVRALVLAIGEVQSIGKKLLEHNFHISNAKEIEDMLNSLNELKSNTTLRLADGLDNINDIKASNLDSDSNFLTLAKGDLAGIKKDLSDERYNTLGEYLDAIHTEALVRQSSRRSN